MRNYKRSNFRKKRKNYKPRRSLKKRKSIFKSRIFWDPALGIILLSSIAYLLFFSAAFQIKEIKIISSGGISLKEIHALLEEELQKPFFHFFRKNSFFLVNSSAIEKKLLKKYPAAKEANLKKKLPGTLTLEIKKRKAVGIWCYSGGEKCFFIDETRIVFREATEGDLEGELVVIFSANKQVGKLAEKVSSEEEMLQVLAIEKELKENLELNLKNFILENHRGLLTAKIIEGWKIYFDLESDIKLALAKLKLLLDKEIIPEERKNLEYIDLRFSKVYYK